MIQTVNHPAPVANRFEMLDLLRGLAAFAVLTYHSNIFLGFEALPSAYIAVDFFFMLSGFVIAHNYDPKIRAGMTLKEFMLQRYIRLYPCYVLAFALGFTLDSARLVRDAGFVDGGGFAGTALPNLFMLPSVTGLYGDYGLFPFNGASWSLMFELIANAIYWLTFRVQNGPRLTALLVIASLGFIIATTHAGSVDIGMRSGELIAGLCRVATTFFAGVALRRYVHDRLTIRLGPVSIAIALIGLMASFCAGQLASPAHQVAAEMFAVLVFYPILLAVMSNTIPGRFLARLCRFAGDTSYPVYILQTPMFFLAAAIPEIGFHHKAILWAPWYGYFEVVAVVAIAWYAYRYYELAMRREMKKWLLTRTPAPAPALNP